MSESTPSTSPSPSTTIDAEPVVVDPGQVIRVNARFPDSPEQVLFSFLSPEGEVVHDPGVGDGSSLIKREGDLYYYSIDTDRMLGGLGWWYFQSRDPDPKKRRAKVGKFIVRDVPRELIGRAAANQSRSVDETSGLDVFGVHENIEPSRLIIGAAVVVGIAIAAL